MGSRLNWRGQKVVGNICKVLKEKALNKESYIQLNYLKNESKEDIPR